MARNTRIRKRAEYLYPLSLIRNNHLTNRDVRRIKDNISLNMTIIRLISGILLFLFATGMMVFMGLATDWKQIEVYGLTSLFAQIAAMIGCGTAVILIVTSYFIKNEKTVIVLNRIAAYFLFLGIAIQMLFGIHADAQMGFTTSQESLSASIIFLAALMVVQPSYWFDAILLDFATTFAIIGLSIACKLQFEMKSLHYYIVIALAFPLSCYFIVTLLFYAECQHYKEAEENERLTNQAFYDSLTLCKNRYSLTSFIEENKKRWEENENLYLLIIMFDIDNFKDYNDRFTHLGGDYCLKAIAEVVRKTFPSPSLDFFRYGGEEFLLFFELDNPNKAKDILMRLQNSVRSLNIEAPKGAPKKIVTISSGATIVNNVQEFSFEKQMDIVDKYLYKSKNNGKDISCLDDRFI